MNKAIKLAAMLAGVATLAVAVGTPAYAQTSDARSQVRDFDVPAQPLAQAVLTFSQQAGVQLVLESGTAQGISSNTVKGRMSVAEALTQLLAGTSLTWHFVNDRTITIDAAPQGAEPERVLGAVRVEGTQSSSPFFGGAGQSVGVNGINGSRDITATEGTGSFTSGALTIGSKVPQAIKDVPQSLSLLTNERLQQQNITDFTTAMKQLPGISLAQGGTSLENTFFSRGFVVSTIQVDGGAPLSMSDGYGYYPQINMAQYDHVELLRGASGLLNGYGDPSGTVNLVRKKPLDHPQFLFEAQAGSWSQYHFTADASSPLGFQGRLRGRLVFNYQSNHHFYARAKDDNTLLYGIAEYDLTPSTTLSAGISYSRQNNVPWANGLMRYQNGDDLRLPRSTSFVFPWNRWDFEESQLFGSITQNIGKDWAIKINATKNTQDSKQKLGLVNYAVDPATGLGPVMTAQFQDYHNDQISLEGAVTGAFDLFGQRQELVLGANHARTAADGTLSYDNPISTYPYGYQPYPGGPIYCVDYGLGTCPSGSIAAQGVPVDVYNFDPSNPIYREPASPLPSLRYPSYGQSQDGAYLNLRLTAFNRLHLTTGIRWSQYKFNYIQEGLCTSIPQTDPGYPGTCYGMQIGDVYFTSRAPYKAKNLSWPPTTSLSFDITKQISAYAGYTDIYRSQASLLDHDHKPLKPVTGSNIEAGIKWAAREGRLNLSIAAYRIKQKNFGVFDPRFPYEQVTPGTSCCWLADPNAILTSKGFDLEATGEVIPGLQLAASYTYSENKQSHYFGGPNGEPFQSIQPKHIYKLWTSYDFTDAGAKNWLSGVTLSAGVNGQSSAYRSGFACVNPTPPDPVSGQAGCVSYGPPDYLPFQFTVPSYVVASAMVGYRLSPVWSIAVNVENIFDKTYYQSVGNTVDFGNWYGAPRSVMATLRAKW